MIGFALGNRMIDCPICWQNFIEAINKNPDVDVPLNRIDSQLKKYRGKFIEDRNNPMGRIEFLDEGDYTWFVLRWS